MALIATNRIYSQDELDQSYVFAFHALSLNGSIDIDAPNEWVTIYRVTYGKRQDFWIRDTRTPLQEFYKFHYCLELL